MKKSILYLLFVLFAISWQTKAQVNTFPWNEDFGGNVFPPYGWSQQLSSSGNTIEQDYIQNHSSVGYHSARFSSYNISNDYNQYFFSKQIHVTAPYTQLTFWHKKYDTSPETLEWGISTSNQTFVDVPTWTAVTLSDSKWQRETIDLSAYVGQDIYLAWHYYGNYSYYVYLDDVMIDQPQACPEPSDQIVSNITSTTADFDWTENGSATNWTVELKAGSDFTPGIGAQDQIANPATHPYAFSSLSPKTTYYWYVKSDCGGTNGTSGWAGPYIFTTAGNCGRFRVDLRSDYIHGWSGGTLTVYVNGTAYLSDLTLPYWTGPDSYYIPVDQGDILSFDYTAGSYDSVNEYKVYNSNGFEVADEGFLGTPPGDIGNTSTPSGLVACPACPAPTGLSVTNITDSQVELSWTAGGNESAWNIEYGPHGFTQGQGTIVSVTDNYYMLTGLSSYTSYDYYVQADCGNGDTSVWSLPYSFKTLCSPRPLPYTQDFNASSGCWTVDDANGDGITWDRVKYHSEIHSCSSVHDDFVMSVEKSNSQSKDDWLFSPGFNLTAATNYIIGFSYGSYGNNGSTTYVEDMDVYLTTGANAEDALTGIQIMSETGISGGCHNFYNPAITVPANGIYYVAFHNNSSLNQDVLMLDDFSIMETPDCPAPTHLRVANITETQAELSWIAGNNETAWNIEYGPHGFSQGQGTTVNVTTNPYTITGLNPGIYYECHVQADCGGNNSTWTRTYYFRTLCAPESLPYTQDFDTTILCWDEEDGNGDGLEWLQIGYDQYGATHSCIDYRTDYVLMAYPDYNHGGPMDDWLFSPRFYLTAGTIYSVAFSYGNGGSYPSSYVEMHAYLTTAANSTTALAGVPIFSETGINDGCHYINNDAITVPVDGVYSVAFHAKSSVTNDVFMIDDFSIMETPSCPAPRNLGLSNITESQVELSWTAGGNESAWNIEYGPTGFTQGQGTTVAVSSNPYTLTGLNSATVYDCYVQADCGGGDTSTWIGAQTFTTLGNCGSYKVDLIDSDGDGWSGGTLTVYVNGTAYLTDLTLSSGFGPESHYIPVNQGDVLSFDYTPGNWSTENEYKVYDNSNVELADEGANGTEPGDIGNPSIPNGLEACTACPAPTGLSVSNITNSQAELSWAAGGNESAWNIEYGPTGFTPGQGTTVSVTSNPYTLTGLASATAYDYYVQADCGSGDVSLWEGSLTFYTTCGVVSTFPYNYGFEDITSNISGDWTISCWSGNPQNTGADISHGPFRWTPNDGETPTSSTGPANAHSGIMYAYAEASHSNYGDIAKLISPVLDLSSLTQPQLSFYFHMYGIDMGSLYVDTFDGTTWTEGVWALSGQQQTSNSDSWIHIDILIPNTVTRIRFRAIRGGGYYSDMAVDDISIVDTPNSIDELSNITAIYPNPTTGEFIIKSHDLNDADVFVYTITGKEIYHSTIDKDTYTVDLKGVKKGVYFVKIVSDDKSYVSKLVIK